MTNNSSVFRWFSTTRANRWEEKDSFSTVGSTGNAGLILTEGRYQQIKGFGGCFNELGWLALSKLGEHGRKKVLDDLFDPSTGCRLNFCRLPIGANDYAAQWYSLNEIDGDFGMSCFSIERDCFALIPYIKEALKRRPDLGLFASPWSPPTWMKYPKVYNYGTFIWEKEYLDAYALYFLKFIMAYRDEGIRIEQVHVQNEPCADQKFPSCVWTGEQLKEFIKSHLGPLFEKHCRETEIWLGTMNSADYDGYANTVLSDDEARKYIKGVGYQWEGREAIQRTHESWPGIRLMQTENECGEGENTWEYAMYVFNLFRHYFSNGAESYIYWNMVLEPGGMSTWGWKQNSLVTVSPADCKIVYNPEFYVMKHFSHFVSPGAVLRGLKGQWNGNSLAFENPDGGIVLVIANPFPYAKAVEFSMESAAAVFELEPFSFNTIVVGKDGV